MVTWRGLWRRLTNRRDEDVEDMPASDLNPKDREAFAIAENPPQAWTGVGAEAVADDIIAHPENALDSPPDEEETESDLTS